jgi:hypothetical protein
MTRRGQSAEDRELITRAIWAAKVPEDKRAAFERDFWASVRMAPDALAMFRERFPTIAAARKRLADLEKALQAVEAGMREGRVLMAYAMRHGVGDLAREGRAEAEAHLSRWFDAEGSSFAAEVAAWRASAAYLRTHLKPVGGRPRARDLQWFAAHEACLLFDLHGFEGATLPLAEVLYEAITGQPDRGPEYRDKVARRVRRPPPAKTTLSGD